MHDVELDLEWRCDDNAKPKPTSIPLRLIPKGIWIVSKNYDGGYEWKFLVSITREDLQKQYKPRFTEDSNHHLVRMAFTDVHETRWEWDDATQRIEVVKKP